MRRTVWSKDLLERHLENQPESFALTPSDTMTDLPEPGNLSVADTVARAWSAGFSLSLGREDATFLAGVHAWLVVNPDPVLDEGQLREVFRIVSEVANGDPATLGLRATNAIARLREQHLLVRADTAGIAQGGEYTLTQLGKAVVEWFTAQEGLTRQSLEVMMTRIRADLVQVKAAAEVDGDQEHWTIQVTEPLRLTVAGLIEIIDRRQRGMDEQQQAIRERIGQMLEEGWFQAVHSCEQLLDTTSHTLHELHRALMHEADGVIQLLTEIDELAERARQTPVTEAVARVRNQTERINAWGESRFQAWSEYYQTVHDFIRSVVRVDQDRAIRYRLRDAIKGYGEPTWMLYGVQQPAYRHLREPEAASETARVERQHRDRGALVEDSPLEVSWLERLAAELDTCLEQEGRASLVAIIRRLLPDHPRDELFVLAGELVEWLLQRGRPEPARELRWQAVGEDIEIQDLVVYRHSPPEKVLSGPKRTENQVALFTE